MLAAILGEDPRTGLDVQYVIDPVNKSMPVEDIEYMYTHLGKIFHLDGALALATGVPLYFLAQVPAGMHLHVISLQIKVADGPVEISLFEGTTFSDAGAAVTPINTNRTSTAVSQVEVSTGPTITAAGARIFFDTIPAGNKVGGLGGEGFSKYLLKDGTTYLFKILHTGSGTSSGSFEFEWVEDTRVY